MKKNEFLLQMEQIRSISILVQIECFHHTTQSDGHPETAFLYSPERFSVIHSVRYSRTRKMWNSVSLLLFQQASQEYWFFYI